MECKNTSTLSTQDTFIDCGEAIKVEDIKEEINEEESVDDSLSIQGETTKDESDNIVTEVKEEVIDDYSLCVQEMRRSNSIVVDSIDIIEHKIKTEIY